MRVALYDFCDTVVSFQTADEFVFFTQEYLGLKSIFNTYMDFSLIRRYYEKNWKKKKKAILYQLRGIKREYLEDAAREYYVTRVRPCIYSPILSLMMDQLNEGYGVYLVSAGYEIYLRYFADEFGLTGVISNDFAYNRDCFSGKLQRKDCYGEEKIIRLNEFFDKKGIDFSISYSDSKSDLPMLKWSDKGVVVSRNSRRKWVVDNHLEDYVLSEHGVL